MIFREHIDRIHERTYVTCLIIVKEERAAKITVVLQNDFFFDVIEILNLLQKECLNNFAANQDYQRRI